MSNYPGSYKQMILYLAELTNSEPYHIITQEYNPENLSRGSDVIGRHARFTLVQKCVKVRVLLPALLN